MADEEVPDLPPASLPLSGFFHLVQGGNSRQADVDDLLQDAAGIPYDNTTSGLVSTDVQSALDELTLFGGGGGGGGATTIELSFYTGGGAFAASEEVFSFIVVTPFVLPSALAGSRVIAGDAALASTVFNLKKNGTNFGTATWAAAGTIATLAAASATSFVTNDILSATAPATPDSTLARVTAAIVGAL